MAGEVLGIVNGCVKRLQHVNHKYFNVSSEDFGGRLVMEMLVASDDMDLHY